MHDKNILEMKDLCVNLMTVRGIIYAVRGVDLSVKKGEIHGVVGESGCGKSVSTKSIMKLHDDTKTEYTGSIMFDSDEGEVDITGLNEKAMTKIRGNEISMIFQDPMTALNPIMRAGEQIAEQLRVKRKLNKIQAKEETLRLFEKVGIQPAEKRYTQYPFEMSGGMLQRVMIAMALSCDPKLLIADEPTTALDVTIQAQILQLIKGLQKEIGTSVIFITHDLGVIAEVCDSVSVMYAGKVVESGQILETDSGEYMKTISGAPPLLYEKFESCPFAPRCEYATEICRHAVPKKADISATHSVSCHNYKKLIKEA